MTSQKDAKKIDQEGKVEQVKRFDKRDWNFIAQFVTDEAESRRAARKDKEKQWKEIDRQVDMIPDCTHKTGSNDVETKTMAWMSEMELPYQAQALEVLTADARRMEFPDTGPWFRAHAEVTDEYLRKVDFQSIVKGDETEVPSKINQDNADKLAEGFLLNIFGQTDLPMRMDRINAEAFKYGMGVGRARMMTKNVYIHEARGTMKEKQQAPVLMPCSIKNLLLDDPLPSMHSTTELGQAHIACDYIRYENITIAASKGSNDPDDEDGGWMKDNLKDVEPDEKGYVELLEMEGDIIVPRKTVESLVLPGAIVTVAVGGKKKGSDELSKSVIRFRWRKYPFSSYLLFPYHYEDVNGAYPTSPLMKGRTIQIAMVQALNRLLDSAALKNRPPVGYDRSDATFAQTGGPLIFPGAQWPTNDINALQVFEKVGGDTSSLADFLRLSINLYAELTGVLPARLGAQTNSHTTAFAKDAELQRGAVRTVNFVRKSGQGPLTRWLDMSYRMARDNVGSKDISFYIPSYGGFVEIQKDHLPANVEFEWFGSGGPSEEAQKKASKLQSLNMAMQIDNIKVQLGGKPRVNADGAIDAVLREGGWTDLDAIINPETAATGVAPNPAALIPSLQALAQVE